MSVVYQLGFSFPSGCALKQAELTRGLCVSSDDQEYYGSVCREDSSLGVLQPDDTPLPREHLLMAEEMVNKSARSHRPLQTAVLLGLQ